MPATDKSYQNQREIPISMNMINQYDINFNQYGSFLRKLGTPQYPVFSSDGRKKIIYNR